MAVHEGFRTTTGGLRDGFALRLYQKAKRLGVWDPATFDFEQDKRDWDGLDELQRETILSLTSLFVAGEEAVTLDLLPLVLAIAREGRIEEELYLTTFLFEEGKHTELFSRFVHEVAGGPTDLDRFHVPSYRTIFYEELPATMERLLTDPSAEALTVSVSLRAPHAAGSCSTTLVTDRAEPRSTWTHCGNALLALSQ